MDTLRRQHTEAVQQLDGQHTAAVDALKQRHAQELEGVQKHSRKALRAAAKRSSHSHHQVCLESWFGHVVLVHWICLSAGQVGFA